MMRLPQLIAGGLLVAIAASVAMLVPPHKAEADTPGTATYKYDSLGRVVQDIYPANSRAYSYDAAGNRVSDFTN
ncbi:RHS repeat domain-containing protein [Bradyrhizobium sp. WD16]|uniref:RHS repeat domain-containing protein n=1 Tax=Bradyrhizobium sp. WD16 TaxID=1521768 RepID=UPI0020A5201A|nr:RHS repeat domain-containing protein [Bradyrhizobium sp. WD16]